MQIFDILGPIMVGPSSSHTAGAVRIGRTARQLLGETPATVKIHLHGSFADTGVGHGTDRALIAGLLGMMPDDERIPDSFSAAKEAGMEFAFDRQNIRGAHPNTALLEMTAADGTKMTVQAASIGGGRIRIDELDGVPVSFSAESNTLIVHNEDKAGLVAKVSSLLSFSQVNIATLQLFRDRKGGTAVMICEIDSPIPEEVLQMLRCSSGVINVQYLPLVQESKGVE